MSTLRQRFPKRIGSPPSRVTGDTATFLRQVSDALNAFPQFSVFSYLTPESNVTAAPVTLGINLADSSATQFWSKTTGYGNTGWTALSQINVPTAHVLATTAALGPEHTVSGLTARQVLIATGATTALFRALVAADLPAAALTKADDTNITLTLGGSATTALINAASITAGWTGTLAAARLNANVVQAITNDTNVTGSIAAQVLTLGWTGTLGLARGGTAADLSATGGASQVLKQTGVGAVVTVAQLAFSDLSSTLAYAQLPTGGGTWANGGALSITGGVTTVAGLTSSALLTASAGASITGNIVLPTSLTGLLSDTADASDTKRVFIAGGGAIGVSRGASVLVYGNDFGAGLSGWIQYDAGNAAGATHEFIVGGTSELLLDSAALKPATAGGLTLGTAALPWGAAWFNGLLTASAGLNLTGTLTMATAISKIVPGATSWGVRNNADSADNIIITDAGVVTFRSTVGGITTLNIGGALGIILGSVSGGVVNAQQASLLLQQSGVTKVTISATDVTFADSIKVASFLDTASAVDLLLRRNGATGLTLGSDGRVWASGIHNSAGAVTGTTNQYIASGTYTPTLTNVANLDASTAYQCQWIRVGNVVTVSGKVDVDPTATGTATSLGISLPIASALVAQEDCAGASSASGVQSQAAAIIADAVNDRAQMTFISVSATNQPMYFTFTYEVL